MKELVCEMSGKDQYEFGDLSIEIDKKVKESVAQFCGEETYEFGMLSKELAKRMKSGVANYTGKSGYKFGDITKTAVKNLTGKEDYQVSVHSLCMIIVLFFPFLFWCRVLPFSPNQSCSLVTLRRMPSKI